MPGKERFRTLNLVDSGFCPKTAEGPWMAVGVVTDSVARTGDLIQKCRSTRFRQLFAGREECGVEVTGRKYFQHKRCRD